MAFCTNCGSQVDEGVKFCPSCGQGVEAPAQAAQTQAVPTQTAQRPAGSTATAQDAAENKVMGILAYLGILALVPLFAAKESKFARYHTNQGLILLLLAVAYSIAFSIISSVLAFISIRLMLAVTGILGLAGWAFLVWAIIGIVNVCKGEMKPLPFIGKYTLLK